MKKLFLSFLVLILLFPITVFARTPSEDETLNVIRSISNVTVDDSITIDSVRVEDNKIILSLFGFDHSIPYEFADNTLSFKGGFLLLDENNQVSGEAVDNEYAFFLYSILENKSNIPYDANNYYNSETIINLVNSGLKKEYKENSNTFGITLNEESHGKYRITYHYYTTGDYPVLDPNIDDSGNPATGNYNILITIMLISILGIGVYSYVNRGKEKA